ncbi:hypothetical protein KUL156_34930 [Alteromonas sp. KUL156]|nr:hypothetical protein KUL154_08930 [Alteromonas sp. KUL154]GFE00901.1 hypothetical protein KUL156_34930 [Alteromonas sp. KUL156]
MSLDFEELTKIKSLELVDRNLDNARDWLLISCFTAQRVSDFLGFSLEDIVIMDNQKLLDINQDKTGNPVYVPISNIVYDILKKHKGFPPQFAKNKESNKAIYNRLIKEVCRLAKINELVTVNTKDSKINRYSIKDIPKWKAVSSHIGRRSFATNYYGKVATSLLISATGHSSEKQFLIYVGKTEKRNAIDLVRELNKIDIKEKVSEMKVVKNFGIG